MPDKLPDFSAFRGLRYRPSTDLAAVTAPPYDVIDAEERDALEARDPHNAVRLILPRPDAGQDPYQHAAALLQAWRAAGVLELDDAPALYGYRMTLSGPDGTTRVTHGVLGGLRVAAGPDNHAPAILPHERTLPKARSDRFALLAATRTNLDPIWGLTLRRGFAELVGEPTTTPQRCVDEDGVTHEVWPITDDGRIARLADAVGATPLVLADGHHRYETACAYRRAHPGDPGAGAILAFVVELAADELCVDAIHRLVRAHGGLDDVRARVSARFVVEHAGSNDPAGVRSLLVSMVERGGLGLVDAGGHALLVPRGDPFADPAPGAAPVPDVLRGVDAAVFEAGIRPLLGEVDVSYRNGAQRVAASVARGEVDAAVLLRPVSVDQIREAAFAGVRMPEKTTYFAPKPRTGMVFRSLDAG